MPELVQSHGGNLMAAFSNSEALLNRCVALPISTSLQREVPKLTQLAIRKGLSS